MVPGCGVTCKVTNIEALLYSRSESVEENNVRNAALVKIDEELVGSTQPALIIDEQLPSKLRRTRGIPSGLSGSLP